MVNSGAFYVYAGGTGDFDNCTISDNIGTGIGGGVNVLGASASFTGCRIENNTAVQGGGVSILVEFHTRDETVTALASRRV